MDPETRKDPNELSLRAERLDKVVLDKYRVKRKSYHIQRAVAKLWTEGVEFNTAWDIVTEAFDAAIAEG